MSGRERWAKTYQTVGGYGFTWLLSVLLLGGLVYPLGVAGSYHNAGGTNAGWIHHMFLRKEAALEMAGTGPRILIVGGSGCLFSIDAEAMERELGQPVINLCSHAGVGLEYMLARARRHARGGDTVLLNPEYRVLIAPDPRQTRIEWDYFTTWDRRHYLDHGLPDAYRMIYGIPFAELWKNRRPLPEGAEGKLHEIYDVMLMTPNGDLHESLGKRPVLAGNLAQTFLPPAELSRQLVGSFVKWARAHDVRVVAAYQAAALDPGDYWHRDAYFQLIPEWWKQLGVQTLGEPAGAVFPSAGFMDTLQHAGPGVSYSYGVQLARHLRAAGAARERLLVPPHASQPLLPLASRLGADVRVYYGAAEEGEEIRRFQRSGGRVFVATRGLAEQLRARGFRVQAGDVVTQTPGGVMASAEGMTVAVCVRPGGPAVAGVLEATAGMAAVGIRRNGQWETRQGPEAAALELKFQEPLATGERIDYRFALRSTRSGCEMGFQLRDRAPDAAAAVRMLVLDTRRGILRGVYNFDASLKAERSWLGEIERQ